MRRSPHTLPILATLAGLACYGVMDGLMKAAAIAIGAYAATFWRNVVGTVVMLPIWLRSRRRNGGNWPTPRIWRLHLTRAVASAAMAILFFYGTVHTPLAEAMALSFLAPLIALFLAAILLGETVGAGSVGGSLLALAGVGVIAAGKLGAHSAPQALTGMIAILASAVIYAWCLVLQRQQAQLAPPEDIAFYQTSLIALILAPGAWWLSPVPLAAVWPVLAGSGALAVISLMMVGWAYARAETQVLVPMEYSAFTWAALIGWIAFGEPLVWRTLAGVALIIAGCLIAARRGMPEPYPA